MKIREINLESFRVRADRELPKYIALEEKKSKENSDEEGGNIMDHDIDITPPKFPELTGDIKKYINQDSANEFNLTISEFLADLVEKSSWWNPSSTISLRSNPTGTGSVTSIEAPSKEPWWKRIFGRTTQEEKAHGPKEYTLDVTDIFDTIKIEVGKEKEFIENVSSYLNLIRRGQKFHQTALVEELLSKLVIHIYEGVLSTSGYGKYIEVERLKDLQDKCERDLSLDYIENYIRIIPESVTDKIERANYLGVFDNYMILHYDPEEKAVAKTEEEKKIEEERRRDPIIFGVIYGSKKLYYLDSWTDEYCDLTLEKVVELLGSEAVGDLGNERKTEE